MSDEARETPTEEVRNSQLLRAEYGIPSTKDEAWRDRSRSADQRFDDVSSRRAVERSIDPLELARTEELIARARFFTRVRAATDTGGLVVGTTMKRVVPVVVGCAFVTLAGVSILAFFIAKRNTPNKQYQDNYPLAKPIHALGVGFARGCIGRLLSQ